MSIKKKLINDPQKIELKSEGMQEIMGTIPTWIITNGTSIIFFTIILLIVFSFIISFPKKVFVAVKISANDEYIYITSPKTGIIKNILIKDNSIVKKDELLLILNNEQLNYKNYSKIVNIFKKYTKCTEKVNYNLINYEDPSRINQIIKLENQIKDYTKSIKNINAKIIVNEMIEGLRSSLSYFNYIKDNRYTKQIIGYKRQLESKKNSINLYREKNKLYLIYYKLSRKQFQRDSISAQKTFISQNKLDQSKINFLNYREKLLDAQIYRESLIEEIRDLKREVQININIRNDQAIDKFIKYSTLKNNLQKLLEKYKNENLIIAPITGRLHYQDLLVNSKNIEKEFRLFAISENKFIQNKQKIKVMATVSNKQSGRIIKGQKVKIKLNDYPFMEYGILKGTVSKITPITTKNNFVIAIDLKNNLTTSYNKVITVNRELLGTGEIIISDDKLIIQFIKPLKSLFKN